MPRKGSRNLKFCWITLMCVLVGYRVAKMLYLGVCLGWDSLLFSWSGVGWLFIDYDFLTMFIGVRVTSIIILNFIFSIYVMSRVLGFKHVCSKWCNHFIFWSIFCFCNKHSLCNNKVNAKLAKVVFMTIRCIQIRVPYITPQNKYPLNAKFIKCLPWE